MFDPRIRRYALLFIALGLMTPLLLAQAPAVGPNINMVAGTKWPAGDPFLTKQNEPSMAVSSLNAQHLLAGANDYRLVDLSQAVDIPGETGAGEPGHSERDRVREDPARHRLNLEACQGSRCSVHGFPEFRPRRIEVSRESRSI